MEVSSFIRHDPFEWLLNVKNSLDTVNKGLETKLSYAEYARRVQVLDGVEKVANGGDSARKDSTTYIDPSLTEINPTINGFVCEGYSAGKFQEHDELCRNKEEAQTLDWDLYTRNSDIDLGFFSPLNS